MTTLAEIYGEDAVKKWKASLGEETPKAAPVAKPVEKKAPAKKKK